MNNANDFNQSNNDGMLNNQNPQNNNGMMNMQSQPNNNGMINNQSPQNNNGIMNNQNPQNSQNGNSNFNQPATNNKQKQNIIKTVGIVAAVVIVLLISKELFSSNNNSVNSNGYTAKAGETLKVYQINGYYDFEVKVLSIEENYPIKTALNKGNCYAVKVSVKNNSTEELSTLAFLSFSLADSSKNIIVSANPFTSIDGALKDTIASGKTETGYLYFYNNDDNWNFVNIDSSKVDTLAISVPKDIKKSGSKISSESVDYYIELK